MAAGRIFIWLGSILASSLAKGSIGMVAEDDTIFHAIVAFFMLLALLLASLVLTASQWSRLNDKRRRRQSVDEHNISLQSLDCSKARQIHSKSFREVKTEVKELRELQTQVRSQLVETQQKC